MHRALTVFLITSALVVCRVNAQLLVHYSFDQNVEGQESGNNVPNEGTLGAAADGLLAGFATIAYDADRGLVLDLGSTATGDNSSSLFIDNVFVADRGDGLNDFTFALWWRSPAGTLDFGSAYFFDVEAERTVAGIRPGSGPDMFEYTLYDGNFRNSGVAVTTNNSWRHIAFVIDDSEDSYTLYLDGVAVTNALTENSIEFNGSAAVGSAYSSTLIGRLEGLVDEVRLYSSALTDEEIQSLASPELRITGIVSISGTNLVSGLGGNTTEPYFLSRSTESLSAWAHVATGQVGTVYTDVVTTAASVYYRLEQPGPSVPQVFFEDDLESGAANWLARVYDGFSNTVWEIGSPVNVGPSVANSGVNAFGTNIDANYGLNSEIGLLTPVINLAGAASATLEFASYLDTEPVFDEALVYVTDAAGTNRLAQVFPAISGEDAVWTNLTYTLPPVALGQEVRLEFYFSSDFFGVNPGWYIDDITVRE